MSSCIALSNWQTEMCGRLFCCLNHPLSSKLQLIFNIFLRLFSPASIQKDWTVTLKTLCGSIIKDQSPNTLMAIRGTFYDLLNHCIPANLILKNLALHILESTDPSLASELCSIFAEYVILFLISRFSYSL